MIIMIVLFTKRLLTNQTSQTHLIKLWHDKNTCRVLHTTEAPNFNPLSTYFIDTNRPASSLWSSPPLIKCWSRLDVFWYRMTNPHLLHCVHIMSNTNVTRIRLFGAWMYWQDSPVTIWNMPRVHTGEVRPTMDITVYFGVLTRSSVDVFSSSRWRSPASFSRSFTCDSLNDFTMVSHLCRCVMGFQVSSFLSHPFQRTL